MVAEKSGPPALTTEGESSSVLAQVLRVGHLVHGELKAQVTLNIADITDRAARAQVKTTRAQFVEPELVRVGLPLLAILVIIFGGAAFKIDSTLLIAAVVAVGTALGIVTLKPKTKPTIEE